MPSIGIIETSYLIGDKTNVIIHHHIHSQCGYLPASKDFGISGFGECVVLLSKKKLSANKLSEYQVSENVVLLSKTKPISKKTFQQTAKVCVTVAGFVVNMIQSGPRTSTDKDVMEKVMSTADYPSCLLRNSAEWG